MLAVLPGKGPTFNTDYLPTFLDIIVNFRSDVAARLALVQAVS
jgi:hypothetical protein